MITPNQLTVLRILLAVVVVLLLFAGPVIHFRVGALFCFILAALTDLWDGRLARRRGMVSHLGIILDPIADKVLVLSTMLVLVSLGVYSIYWILPILIREVVVTLFRFYALSKRRVLAAEKAGKVKTVLQYISLGVSYITLFMNEHPELWAVRLGWLPTLFSFANLGFIFVVNVVALYSGILFLTHHRCLNQGR